MVIHADGVRSVILTAHVVASLSSQHSGGKDQVSIASWLAPSERDPALIYKVETVADA